MPLYEVGLIIDPELDSDEEKATLDALEEVITKGGGEVMERDAWGRRELAYSIQDHTHGVYHFWKFQLDGDQLEELNFVLKTNDHVLRSLTLNMDRELKRVRKRERVNRAEAAKKAAKSRAAAEAEA